MEKTEEYILSVLAGHSLTHSRGLVGVYVAQSIAMFYLKLKVESKDHVGTLYPFYLQQRGSGDDASEVGWVGCLVAGSGLDNVEAGTEHKTVERKSYKDAP